MNDCGADYCATENLLKKTPIVPLIQVYKMGFSFQMNSLVFQIMKWFMLKYHIQNLRGPKVAQIEMVSRAAQKEAAGPRTAHGCFKIMLKRVTYGLTIGKEYRIVNIPQKCLYDPT